MNLAECIIFMVVHFLLSKIHFQCTFCPISQQVEAVLHKWNK